jgi:hypothetical protein
MKKATSLKLLAKDLRKEFPRSPRFVLGGYVIAARTLDKCRAVLAGTAGEYHFNCPLDNFFFGFTGIEGAKFKKFVATGANDDEVAAWIVQNAKKRKRIEIIRWNNEWREKRIGELPDDSQEYYEDYIPKVIPRNRAVHHFFDVYDIEEQRI